MTVEPRVRPGARDGAAVIHFDEVDVTELAAAFGAGRNDEVAAIISKSDNPSHTALSLLRRVAIDENLSGPLFERLNRLQRIVEYQCILPNEDVIAELRAGDVNGALRCLGVPSNA